MEFNVLLLHTHVRPTLTIVPNRGRNRDSLYVLIWSHHQPYQMLYYAQSHFMYKKAFIIRIPCCTSIISCINWWLHSHVFLIGSHLYHIHIYSILWGEMIQISRYTHQQKLNMTIVFKIIVKTILNVLTVNFQEGIVLLMFNIMI